MIDYHLTKDLTRDQQVLRAAAAKLQAQRVAETSQHPAEREFQELWGRLGTEQRAEVQRLVPFSTLRQYMTDGEVKALDQRVLERVFLEAQLRTKLVSPYGDPIGTRKLPSGTNPSPFELLDNFGSLLDHAIDDAARCDLNGALSHLAGAAGDEKEFTREMVPAPMQGPHWTLGEVGTIDELLDEALDLAIRQARDASKHCTCRA